MTVAMAHGAKHNLVLQIVVLSPASRLGTHRQQSISTSGVLRMSHRGERSGCTMTSLGQAMLAMRALHRVLAARLVDSSVAVHGVLRTSPLSRGPP
eukprot:1363831-Amphidinium_carterae.1